LSTGGQLSALIEAERKSPHSMKGSAPSSDATPAFVPAIVEDEPPSPVAPALTAAVAMVAAGVDPAPIEIALGGVIVPRPR